MLKFAIILALGAVLFRWALGKWPWQMLSGPQSRSQKLAEARKILGVSRKATRAEILSAHKKLIAQVHPDRGGSSGEVHDANDARDLLLADLALSDGEQSDKDTPV
ncbi:J domain-containing protein [Erythrobacter sp. SCSIO 43205]|uniref:J domain-containing protein n=1 Tax=Erythrobacter sp. SCSIO 43205 TaxID=2779361 RepID=UPI001CA992FC|nr:J domain-containing protein [Erythrobacter sp. SCSIO 43205]UAB78352.1 J domain-containing protein [Erythrobacter sp. SCSIO 43205]